MRKRQYIVYVTRDEQGHLQKVPIPMHYAYVFVAAAVVGLFTITGLAGSYTRMLLKTEHFNQLRNERAALQRDYQQLQSVTKQKDMQVASLGSLAGEVSALYGLRQSKLLTAKTVAAPVTDTSDGLSSEGYAHSLDQFYALRTSALSGVTANALSAGISSSETLTDWVRLADAPSLWPVTGPITSSFGERIDPMGSEGMGEFHRGIDIGARYGDAVHATADGTVEAAGMASGYGREVILDHGHGMQTLYAHLSAMTVSAGETVSRGQIIGYVGQTGRATGPNLHYEVRINGTPVNPHRYMRITIQQLATSVQPAQMVGGQ
ncbi:MAG TPA: M23 family metallopeptidase [Acidobacteriaceae bacterium]|nr:M23 family metallopeptidase [Acidobacteriaceae bacterium]